MKELWELFWAFAKIGVMTFGGGAAMLPILDRELVEKRQWVNEEELADYYAIGQCTPGVIAINTSTFVGRKRKGDLGGVIATAGMAFPSLVIILILASIITNFAHLSLVQNAFAGIRVCVCVQIFNAVCKLAKKALVDRWTVAIFLLVFGFSIFVDLSPVIFVLLSGGAGILLHCLGLAEKGAET